MAIMFSLVIITLLVILILIMLYRTSNTKNLIKNMDSKANNTAVEAVDLENQRRIRDMESEIKTTSGLTSDIKRSIWDFMISRKHFTESGTKTKKEDENSGHGDEEIMEIEHVQNSLPFELMADILSRLPCKTLAKLRCVCTQWNTLLNYNKYFILEHHYKALHDRPMLISCTSSESKMIPLFNFTEDDEINDCSVNQIAPMRHCKVSNPVHGLVCLFEKYHAETDDQYLFNPTTREIARLPKLIGRNRVRTCSVGLGYDENERAYKIVKMTEKRGRTGSFCEVLTIGSKEWRLVDETPFVVLKDRQCCFSNGRLHWLTKLEEHPLSLGVLSFDMKQERLSLILIAMEFNIGTASSEVALTVSGDRFYLLQDSSRRLQIWELQCDDNASFKGKSLFSTDMSSYVPVLSYEFQVAHVDVHNNKALFHTRDGLYYFHNRKLLKVYSVVNVKDIQWLHAFAESLVSPRRLLNDSVLL